MDFYHFAICHVCKKPSPDLKKCSKCKVLHYCSPEHQKQDWPEHKELCKVITKSHEMFPGDKKMTVNEFSRLKFKRAAFWHLLLHRSLEKFEHEMWMFPKVCAVCFTSNVNLICPDCISVAYCSEDHQKSDTMHGKFCLTLKMSLDVELAFCKCIARKKPLNFTFKQEVLTIPENITEFLKITHFTDRVDEDSADFVMMSEMFAFAVNVLYALTKSEFIDEKRLGKKNKVVLHWISRKMELSDNIWLYFTEILSHWIVNLKYVEIYVIDTVDNAERILSFVVNCEECLSKGFTVYVETFDREYKKLFGEIPRPDLVLTVNYDNVGILDSGFEDRRCHLFDMIQYEGVPILFTSCHKLSLTEKLHNIPPYMIKFLVQPKKNSYASLRPIRNFNVGLEPVYYFHKWIAIFAKK